ncbi:CLUMA_CG017826, isoform A [Clunio marinus]|uniref:CLUMA_CG017826, isoform A n=1 Tax=Clunio marinus TaxID=568069 RepID=A0A1J1J023_9DIPT|nr:CLUMA_CG017826, isoform A [Clunio marinus]
MDKSNERKSVKNIDSSLYVFDKEFYPETWKDDFIMSGYLYKFRPREVNAENYDQKMRFWKEMIENYCEYKGSADVTIQELKRVFKRKGTVPYCLSDVLNSMSTENSVMAKDDFMSEQKSLASWAVNSLIVKPMSWGFGKIKETLIGSNAINEETTFVVKSALIYQSKILEKHVKDRHSYNNIISMDELMENLHEIEGLSRDGVFLALHHLSSVEKRVYIEDNRDENESTTHHKLLMKFCEPHEKLQPITEIERSIYNLGQTEKFLIKTIDKKEKDLDDTLKKVKSSVKDGKKQIAKTFLRKKHLIENDLIKSIGILDNVQAMLQKVQSSKSDKEIFNAYKIGSEAIKKAFSEEGVNLDKVHDVIEDMQEIYQDQEEYEAAISEPLRGPNAIDDSDLERELMELINEKGNEVENNQKPGNDGGQKPKTIITENVTEDLESLDRELEMRLKRLRSDLSDIDETNPQEVTTNTRKAGVLQ